ncbi:gastric triacylglycerol lipase-like isoform X2 [Periplaneta americana]|uniref:gastric triacylglycerol lipase-like isoform X2 n=1 Tax=Periplaneta americana TaxID=6978 RepID=UPI0037E82690
MFCVSRMTDGSLVSVFRLSRIVLLGSVLAVQLDSNAVWVKAGVSEALMSATELIHHYGYPVEEHAVQTDDGYILTHFRIPNGRNSSGKRQPVILQHGLSSAADAWLFAGKDKSLGFILADAGYDVWLTNIRGNRYCLKHISLSPDFPKFWDFSWHEMGYYDLPATIDYILAVTQQPTVYYVGYSMGNTMLYVMTSTRPEYNEKLKIGINLSPVVYIGNLSHPIIRAQLQFVHVFQAISEAIEFRHIPHIEMSLVSNIETFCQEGTLTYKFCIFGYILSFGGDIEQLNKTLLPTIITHNCAGTSTKTLLHYSQLITSGKFRAYDYGSTENMKLYGQATPPDYDLKNVTMPMSLYYGDGDLIVSPKVSHGLVHYARKVRYKTRRSSLMNYNTL